MADAIVKDRREKYQRRSEGTLAAAAGEEETQTTTRGGPGHSCALRERVMELAELRVMSRKSTRKEKAEHGSVSDDGVEEVVAMKVKRKYRLRDRLAPCFCSSCQDSKYDECHVHKVYPALVPEKVEGEVKENSNNERSPGSCSTT